VAPNRRGLINEIAFNVYSAQLKNVEGERLALFAEAFKLAQLKLSKLRPLAQDEYTAPTNDERADCYAQIHRMTSFFRRVSQGSEMEISPTFPGAGIIDTCQGDIFFGTTLYEIKAGQRNFRATDIKQLLTYAALNKLTDLRSIRRLGIFNPRMGISYEAPIDEICLEVSGCQSEELLAEIVKAASSGELSR
jgi:hypothetical protein